jgi:Zn-dependent peptidase ImmA (M78 family)
VSKVILQRGFKANAERKAALYRQKLGLDAYSAICAFKLAAYLNISIYPATDFLTLESEINTLSNLDDVNCGWSALTMKTKQGNTIIIHNSFHSAARQQSDVMHELAHIICEHSFLDRKYDFEIPMGMRSFNEVYEEEAKCLGATLQIPRSALIWALKRKMNNEEMAAHFNASIEMVNYRLRLTGVNRQLSYL